MTQEFDTIEERAKEELGKSSMLDDLVENKVTLEDLTGEMPSAPNLETQYKSMKSSMEQFDDFKKMYLGEEDQEVEVKVEGRINKFFKRFKTNNFGGTEKQVIKGKMGLLEESENIYTSAKKSIQDIKGGMPELNSGIQVVESYCNRITEDKQEHEYIYQRCQEKEFKINNIKKEVEMKKKYDDAMTADEKRKLNSLEQELDEKTNKIYLTKKAVAKRISNYDNMVTKQKDVVGYLKKGFNELTTSIAMADTTVEYFYHEVQSMKPMIAMAEYASSVDDIVLNISNHIGKIDEAAKKQVQLLNSIVNNGNDFKIVTNESVKEFTSLTNQYSQDTKDQDQRLFGEVDKIINKNKPYTR